MTRDAKNFIRVLKEFQDLRWVPMQPKFMDYPNAQFLMIGEAQDKLGKGGMTEEKAPEEEEAAEELENLEHENEVRAHPLKGMFPVCVWYLVYGMGKLTYC